MNSTDITPAMKQYMAIKEEHPDCILFFRMGDFYEMFFDDAVTASQALEITLTSRNKNKTGGIPLCGVPYHAGPSYIAKLIEKGFKVAVCEQMEDPKLAKGVVKREVVRIITPGLVVDQNNLEAKENNFLGALSFDDGIYGLAFIDISTGEFRITESSDKDYFIAEWTGLHFREMICGDHLRGNTVLNQLTTGETPCRVNYFPGDYFDRQKARTLSEVYFPDERLNELGIDEHPAVLAAVGAVLRYVEETQKERLTHINAINWYGKESHLILDDVARRNLELFSTIADGKKEGSLFHVLDQTATPMGGRRLRWWLNYPLINPEAIKERLSAVAEIKDRHLLRDAVRKSLARMYDLERLGARIAMGVANGRDLIALKASLQALPAIRSSIHDLETVFIRRMYAGIDEMPDVADLIERAICEEPPVTVREGGIIKEGYDDELDKTVDISRNGRKWIAALEEKERRKTGINSLKVGFNSVFGYYIEVTKANAANVPDDYVRKQTLVNAERYINQELKEYEYTVLNAEDRRKEREYDLFLEIRNHIAGQIKRIQTTASSLADLDVIAGLAEIAERYNYCCPQVEGDDVIEIKDGRHPVVERMRLAEGFVPNDIYLDMDRNRCLIITGPNMAGKSTCIRQVALIVLLAQMGSFVPAASAKIGVVDRIFTRIGAADSLAKGQSTFMVEMTEVANILKNATARSLVILDEVGRGTSTFDGLSIAWAVAEYIHDVKNLGARTLFATHYHQLTEMALTRKGVMNYNIAVKEWGDRIIFLRKLVAGGTNRSYGIQVAKIAGLPDEVVLRAYEILQNMEKGELDEIGMPRMARSKKATHKNQGQLSLFMDDDQTVISEIKNVNILNMTPMDAMNMISKWKDKLKIS
ncbi:MAG: DNA mismatch repair protein MutS [Deltaproteobacteria bacterium]|nr:DNA mismatch repair protein MutS [Deltaproteobacteria bacterium]